ncbi:MAG: DNA recombination protein RmuC [Candidatus Blackburnbacteria bacterium]|nr:DNA recombination protein RmuC [Candidatus Blackburnbacteria bacterium]
MTQEMFLVLIVVAGGFLGIVWIVNRRLSKISENNTNDALVQWLKANQEVLAQSNKNITDTLQQNTRDINERLDRAARVIGDLQKEAGQFSEVSRSMKDLQDYLKSPKLRGNLGEEVLNDLLMQSLPRNAIFLQYQFKSGDKVDAALKTDAGIIPIDSKFPMENFQRMMQEEKKEDRERGRREFGRDVRHHIDAIAKKYILPQEGTVDFAIMYVPSESVYYEIVTTPEIIKYARSERVYPVSPTTLYAHLRIILMSFEGKKIEQQARQILSAIRAMQKDYEKTGSVLGVLGRHINNAYNSLNTVTSSFTQLGQKIYSTQALGQETMDEEVKLEPGSNNT